MIQRVVFFIDGFNVYHSLANKKYDKYKWLDYHKLTRCFISPKIERVESIHYFSAFAYWNPSKFNRHRTCIQALRFFGVNVVLGKFKRVTRKCRASCKKEYFTFEEKETDVNIAIYLLKKAYIDEFDTAYIVSGDSDLVPAIEEVKSLFPHKTVKCIVPIGRTSEHIKKVCDFNQRMKELHLSTSQLPDTI